MKELGEILATKSTRRQLFANTLSGLSIVAGFTSMAQSAETHDLNSNMAILRQVMEKNPDLKLSSYYTGQWEQKSLSILTAFQRLALAVGFAITARKVEED